MFIHKKYDDLKLMLINCYVWSWPITEWEYIDNNVRSQAETGLTRVSTSLV